MPVSGAYTLKTGAQPSWLTAVQVGLSDMATYSQDGTKVSDPKFPFKLFIVPSEAVQRADTPKRCMQLNSVVFLWSSVSASEVECNWQTILHVALIFCI